MERNEIATPAIPKTILVSTLSPPHGTYVLYGGERADPRCGPLDQTMDDVAPDRPAGGFRRHQHGEERNRQSGARQNDAGGHLFAT